MTYNPSIPQAGDNLSTSQGQMLNNFTQLNNVFGNDHFPFDYATTGYQGEHQFVTFPVPLGSDPSPTGTASVAYTKSVSGVPQLFFANSSGVSQVTGVSGTVATTGSVTFPGGLTMKWGVASAPAGFSNTVTFGSIGQTNFANNMFTILANINTSSVAPNTTTLTVQTSVINKTSFALNTSSSSRITSINYIALGN